MKTKTYFILLTLIAVISFSSCKKSEDTNPITGNGSISLSYDGTAWSATLAVQAVNSNGVINVTGSDSDAHQAAVTLVGVSTAGTYEITSLTGNQLRWTEGLGTNDTYSANGIVGSGSIVVEELSDTHIKGTFSFVGQNTNGDSRNITNGKFEADF